MAELPKVNVSEISDDKPYVDIRDSITQNRETLQRSIRAGLALLRKQVEFLTLTQKALVVENALGNDAEMDSKRILQSVDADTTSQIKEQILTNLILKDISSNQKQILEITQEEIRKRVEEEIERRGREGSLLNLFRNMFFQKREEDRKENDSGGLFAGLAGLAMALNPFRLLGLRGGLGATLFLGITRFVKLLAKGGLLFLLFAGFKTISENEELKKSLKELATTWKEKVVPIFNDIFDAVAPIATKQFDLSVKFLGAALTDLAGGLKKIMEGDLVGGFKQILVGEDGNGGLVNSTIKFITDSINNVFGTNIEFKGLATFVQDLERSITDWIIKNTPEFLRDLLNVQTTRELAEEELGDILKKLEETEKSRGEMSKKLFAANQLFDYQMTLPEDQRMVGFDAFKKKRDQLAKLEKDLMSEETRLSNLYNERLRSFKSMEEFDLRNPTDRALAEKQLEDLAKELDRIQTNNLYTPDFAAEMQNRYNELFKKVYPELVNSQTDALNKSIAGLKGYQIDALSRITDPTVKAVTGATLQTGNMIGNTIDQSQTQVTNVRNMLLPKPETNKSSPVSIYNDPLYMISP